MATFAFDGPTKRISVDAEGGNSAFAAAEVYSAWKDWVRLGNAQYEPAFSESVGGNALGGGSSLDTYVFLRNDIGWRIRPDARDHTLRVDGQLFGASDVLPVFTAPLSAAIVTIERSFSVRAVGVDTAGSSPADVASAVWAATAAGNNAAGTMGEALNAADGGSTPSQVAAAVWAYFRSAGIQDPDSMGQAIAELYALMGLDANRPLVVTPTSRSVSALISQHVARVASTVTVTRNP